MAIVNYNIASGAPPFEAELVGSGLPVQQISSLGTYHFYNVSNGVYTLTITDGNGCVFEREITVDPSVTTTTTTVVPGNSIVIGNTQDPITIFNPDATNRSGEYTGYPDSNIVNLYVWFQTLDGKALTSDVTFNYTIKGNSPLYASQFTYVDVSDQIHAEVIEGNVGPITPLNGNVILKTGFIETFFNYTYFKGIDPTFTIDITSPTNRIYTGIPIQTNPLEYGINTLNNGRIIMNY